MRQFFKLSFLFIPLVLVASSCLKTRDNPAPDNFLKGSYKGAFFKLKLKSRNPNRFDTLRRGVINLSITDSGYRVTADTLGLHAANTGSYAYDLSRIQFSNGATVDTIGRVSLNGEYLYGGVSGTDSLLMRKDVYASDTTVYFYRLNRTN